MKHWFIISYKTNSPKLLFRILGFIYRDSFNLRQQIQISGVIYIENQSIIQSVTTYHHETYNYYRT
jgi:hypothetical protein